MSKYGYRNVWYNARKKCMHHWTWDDDGNRIESVESFNPYLYVETSVKADGVSLFNTNLKKIVFPSQFERRKYVKECGIKRLFFNLKAEQQFLLEKYLGLNESFEFSEKPLKIFSIDIEVYAPDEFPSPEHARHPINLFTIHDSLTNHFHAFGLQPYTPKLNNVTYYHCKSESDLLQKVLDYWMIDYPDVVTGWNSDGFDIPYIINRITQVLGEEYAQKLSPVESIYYKADIAQKFGKTIGRWIIHGLNCVDYKDIYQTFSREKRESYSLDYISKVELKEGKIKINATNLAVLSNKNWAEYVDYNIQDVSLLNRLEEKLRYLKTMRAISHKGFCNVEHTMGKVMVVAGAIAAQGLKYNKILCTFEHDDMGEYSGGYVKDIEPGLREGVVTFDANSLYPNVIITLNLSPETKIGKIINVDKDKDEVEIRLVNGKIHTLSNDNFNNFVRKENISISRAKVLFSQKSKGIVPEYVDGLYVERIRNKKKAEEIERLLPTLDKKSNDYATAKRQMEQLDILQYTLKILLNSIYGVFANKHGPLYDIDCAGSITLTGQAVIKQASQILDDYVNEKYDIKNSITLYNDTDSCHVTLKPILDLKKQPMIDEKGLLTPAVYDIAIELNTVLNDDINKWSKDVLNSADSRFFFKRESICTTALYQAKKRYILHIKDKGESKPMPVDKIKPVGVELVKSTMSDVVKEMIRKVVVAMLNTRDRTKTIDVYRSVYEEFKKLPALEVAFRSAIKTFDKYSSKSNGFAIPKHTPIAVSGAIYYNNLLKEYKLQSHYESLKQEDRVKWVYCQTNNKYNIGNLAFVDKIPSEFVDIKIDYDKMFKKALEPAIERLFECAGWRMVDLQSEYTVDLLDLFKA